MCCVCVVSHARTHTHAQLLIFIIKNELCTWSILRSDVHLSFLPLGEGRQPACAALTDPISVTDRIHRTIASLPTAPVCLPAGTRTQFLEVITESTSCDWGPITSSETLQELAPEHVICDTHRHTAQVHSCAVSLTHADILQDCFKEEA